MKQPGLRISMGLCALLVMQVATGRPAMAPSGEQQDVLTNQTIIEMKELGFADELIIEKIKASPGEYDTSLEALKALRDAGISDAVLAEMMRAAHGEAPLGDPNDPLSPHEPGIYLSRETDEGLKIIRMEPTVSMQTKTGGVLKYAFSYGAAKIKNRAIINGLHADFKIKEPRPIFYFYFGEEARGFGGITPKEFAMVQMKMRQNKGWREVVVGTFNIAGGKAGVIDKFAVEFESEELAPAIHTVVPKNDLPPGDYCFYYGGGPAPGAGGAIFAPAGGGVKVFQFCTH